MTNAGDDSTRTVPVIDNEGGTLALPSIVMARNSDGDEVEITASWATPVAPIPDREDGATFRDIDVPLVSVPRGLWGFRLVVDGGEDVFLFNEVLQ
ncbi:MAG TPA: hypothetical protein VGE38_06900 [Nocardioides sp.]|uniref:hypothetical protein n=1 Tax=Nocardioides sp. TaxID=35761 RepID=UPI002ED78C81